MKNYTSSLIRTNIIRCILVLFYLILFSQPNSYSQSWNALSTGTNLTVFASAVFNGNLIAAGDFTTVGGVTVNRIAQWNGTNWSALGNGMDSAVLALEIFNGELIAAGKFTNAGGTSCNKIAKWNGTNWSALGLGANDVIYALSVYAGSLRVGGLLTSAGGVTVNHIGKWDGNSWASMTGGVNDVVYTLALFGSDLILGGRFTQVMGFLNVKRIASYNVNGLYSGLGSGIDSGAVLALYNYNNSLIVGGDFTTIGGITVNYIASWNGSNWINLGNGMNARIRNFSSFNNNLIVGGKFTNAGGTPANYIAGWNGTNYFALGNGMSGGITEVDVLNNWSNILIAGGNFTTAGGVSALNIAAWGSIPVAPTLINPCSMQNDSLTPLLTWNSVSNATSYGLQVSDNPNFTSTILNLTQIPITQYQIPNGILSYNTTYFWRVNASNGLGTGPWSLVCFFSTNPLGIVNNNETPKIFKLYQNYPNPFNPETIIKFDLPNTENQKNISNISLIIYDVEGKEILKLFDKKYETGSYEVKLNGAEFPSGIYFYKLVAGSFMQTNKMILLK